MTDRKKVINGLEHCSNKSLCNDDCPYSSTLRDPNFGVDECTTQLAHDALKLLKEKEPVKPKSKVRHGAYGQIQHFCGNCNAMLHGKQKYCSECGRKVKWDDMGRL